MSTDSLATTLRDGLRTPLALVRRAAATDELLHHGGVMAFATVAAGGFNYLFQLFMGNALGPHQYGVFGSLFALFYLVHVVGRGVRLSATRFTAEYADDPRTLASFHRGWLVRALAFGCAMFVGLSLLGPRVAAFLDLDSALPVVVVAATMPFNLALPANFGHYQGREAFLRLGSYKVTQAAVKVVLAVTLVTLGFGVFGAFGAIGAAALLVLALSTVHARRSFETSSAGGAGLGTEPDAAPDRGTGFDYARAYRYVLPAVLVGFCLTVPANVDVILAKHFFTARQAGLYTAVSVLGKILVFLPLGISTALFPKASDGDAETAGRLFDRAILYTATLAGAGALGYWLLPELVLATFFGESYVAAASLLQWYAGAVLAFAVAVVALEFHLARDRMGYVYLFGAVSCVEIVLLWTYHASMVSFAHVLLAANAGLAVVGIAGAKR